MALIVNIYIIVVIQVEVSLKTGGVPIFSQDDITVVILSRGRERQLSSSVKYWNRSNLRVVVLHNTQSPLPADSFASNVKYIVLEKDFASRCKLAAQEIKSKYAVFCADDELLLPSGLSTMAQYLESHPEISSVGGKTIGIAKYGRNLTSVPTYQSMNNYKNSGKSYFERLEHHTYGQKEYRSGAMYRLMRAELMIQNLNLFSHLSDISTPYIFEVTAEIVVNGMGKTFYLDSLYWIRNWISDQVEHNNWDRKRYFKDWWTGEEYSSERSRWINLLSDLSEDSESVAKTTRIVEGLVVQRSTLEIRELTAKAKLRSKVPDGLRKIKQSLTPRILVKNNTNRFLKNLSERDPKLASEVRTALMYLN